jgi:hypothetical protein
MTFHAVGDLRDVLSCGAIPNTQSDARILINQDLRGWNLGVAFKASTLNNMGTMVEFRTHKGPLIGSYLHDARLGNDVTLQAWLR